MNLQSSVIYLVTKRGHLNYSALSRLTICLFSLVCSTYFVAAAEKAGQFYEYQIEPRHGENFSFAQIQCWLPPAKNHLNGILCVVLHPHGDTGVHFDDPKPWIALADRYQFALLSISFVPRDSDINPWCHASAGTGRALLASIDKIADASGTLTLRKAALVVAGICEAGQFSYEFSAWAPERTKAFVTIGGGKHDLRLAGKAAGIPGLLIAATDRGNEALDNMFGLFAKGAKDSSPWAFAAEQIADYDRGRCSSLATSFLEAILSHLDKKTKRDVSSKSEDAVAVPLQQMILPIQQNPDIANMMTKIQAGGLNCRFPNQATAEAWEMQNTLVDARGLSFVSVPLPQLATVTPSNTDIGNLSMELPSAIENTVNFNVRCVAGANVDDVKVVTEQKGITCRVERFGDCDWRIGCKVEPKDFPCGAFHIEIPIRLFRSGKSLPGGFSTFMSGHILGDIRPEPAAINISDIVWTGGEKLLRLTSKSGSKINVLSIQSDYPDRATAKVERVDEFSVELRCKFNFPPETMGVPLTGYFLVRVKSKYEQLIKVLFYGVSSVR